MRLTNREQDLMNAAIKLFQEKGYHGTSIRDLADAIGLQKSALYHYVGSKESLLFRISDETLRESLGIMKDIYDSPISNVERLRRALEHHVEYVATRGTATTVFLRDIHVLSKERRRKILDLARDYRRVWEDILRQGMETGEFRPGDVKLLTMAILGAGNWVAIWYNPKGTQSAEAVANVFADFFLSGLLSSGETSADDKLLSAAGEFHTQMSVRWSDLDVRGTLPLPTMLNYCDEAMNALLTSRHCGRDRLMSEFSSVLRMVRGTAESYGTIEAGSALHLTVGVSSISRRAFAAPCTLTQDGRTVGRAEIAYETVEAGSGVSVPLPQPLHRLLSDMKTSIS